MPAIVTCGNCGTRNRLPTSVKARPRCARCKSDLPWSVDAGDDDFADATATRLPVLVDLWAPWCGPCRMVAPAVQQLAEQFAGTLKVVKVNVDEAPRVSARFGVQSIPMLLMMRGGELVDSRIGALPREQLDAWVTSTVG